MTSPLVGHEVERPDEGPPFAWAKCAVCPDELIVHFDPVDANDERQARAAASNWARDHRCHPAGRALAAAKADNWADEYLTDSMFGQFEDGAA